MIAKKGNFINFILEGEMKFFFKALVLVLLFCAKISSVNSQGILIFEISDVKNKPVSGLSVDVKKDGVLYKNYQTDASGRLVDMSIPEGDYTYSFDYGDCNTGSFTIKKSDWVWIDLDYRTVTITFKDDASTLLEGKKATIHKLSDGGEKTYVAEKFSDVNGVATFVLPKGRYTYTTFRGTETIDVNDENINSSVIVTSGEITHQTHFSFVKKSGEKVDVYAKDILVTHIAPDSLYLFGAVDAHSNVVAHGYYLYNTTDNYVSCPAGTYSCTVETKDYGTIVDTFIVDDNDALVKNIVNIVLPDLPVVDGSQAETEEEDVEEEMGIEDELTPGTPYSINVKVFMKSDSITPIPNVLCSLLDPMKGLESKYNLTDGSGWAGWFVTPDYAYDVAVLNDTIYGVSVTSDTTLYFYLDGSDFTEVYFDFYYGEEKFEPISISEVVLWNNKDVTRNWSYFPIPMPDGTFSFKKPVLCPRGIFNFTFYVSEKGYNQRYRGFFRVAETDSLVRVPITLTPYYNVKINVLDINGMIFESRQYVHVESALFMSDITTDSLGKYSGSFLQDDYVFSVLGDTQRVELRSDTTLTFRAKAPVSQKVLFQFLHDGKLVYPQIMSMNLYGKDGKLYSKTVSTQYENYQASGEAWVFSEPTICVPDDYTIEYVLKDYEYNGTYSNKFTIKTPLNPDTTIYIVVPVKRCVTITIKDANLDLVNGVFGNIYKYGEDGNLLPTTDYDDASHSSLRTNSSGEIRDYLVPGRYQIRILDIVRDFIVKDYDLNFDIISGTKLYDVKYVVMYEKSKNPGVNILLDVNKDSAFYSTNYTDDNGVVELFCESGNYSYYLHYGENNRDTFVISNDTTIYIYLEDPVLIENLNILGCACISHGDSLTLTPDFYPQNSTVKDLVWSIDNEILARVTSDGVLIANKVVTEGFVKVTATTQDGSGVVSEKFFYVGGEKCGVAPQLSIGSVGLTEIPLTTDSVLLTITLPAEDKFDRVFAYQVSSDTINWETIVPSTTELSKNIFALNFKKESYFRVLSSVSEADLAEFLKNQESGCGSNQISNIVALRLNSLRPVNWPDSICALDEAITLIADKESVGTIAEGYALRWFVKKESATEFEAIPEFENKDTLVLKLDETSEIRMAIENESVVVSEFKQSIFVEPALSFALKSDKDTVCFGDDVQFSAEVLSGAIGSFLWNNTETSPEYIVEADSIDYILKATSMYGHCPAQFDTIRLVVDSPIDITLQSSKSVICETETNEVSLYVDSKDMSISSLTWSDGSTTDTIKVLPTKSAEYSLTALSKYNKCPSVKKEISVEVKELMSISLDADKSAICQTGNDSITLSVSTSSGLPETYVWFDGVETADSVRKVKLDASTNLWAVAKNGVCQDSEADSFFVQVAKPAEIELSTSNKIFEYGADIDLSVDTSSFVYGPFSWISVDEEGNEQILSITDELQFSDMPSSSVTYYVKADNGACPIITSGSLVANLVDNIEIPTVITPHTADGINDDFMPGYRTIIYNRYGDVVSDSDNGWDGMFRGELADPGVYIYSLILKDGREVKGTIEVFKK